MPTPSQAKAAVSIIVALAETIRSSSPIPSGHLYAMVMGSMSFESYSLIIAKLENLGLISIAPSHLITWREETLSQPSANHAPFSGN
jgi:hypothetical protein